MPTVLSNLINPQVMGDMISATLPKKIKFSPIAKIDNTLQGQPGNTITVPKYAYIGDAEDVAEGVAIGTTVLTASTTTATIKKAGKAVEITDEAVLSGYGDPLGEATNQLAMSIASKVDNDCYDALLGATLKHDGTAGIISYNGVVDGVDKFTDENDEAIDKIIFVHPNQVTQLRKDSNFLDINKYPVTNGVIMTGLIGMVAGCKVVKSKKCKLVKYEKDNDNGTITIVADSTTETTTNKHLDTIAPNCVEKLVVGDKVKAVSVEYFTNPIVTVDVADPNEAPGADGFSTAMPALTIYMKRNVLTEKDRDILKKTTVVSADQHYGVCLSNDSKVVFAKFKASA